LVTTRRGGELGPWLLDVRNLALEPSPDLGVGALEAGAVRAADEVGSG
jgi:hypothetical protein